MVSGTPGRVYDLIKRQDLSTRGLKAFVIDEADEMLNKGFKEQVGAVVRGVTTFLTIFCLDIPCLRSPLMLVLPRPLFKPSHIRFTTSTGIFLRKPKWC